MKKREGKRWTPLDLMNLKILIAKGTPMEAIAKKLKRTVNAIQGKVIQKGLYSYTKKSKKRKG